MHNRNATSAVRVFLLLLLLLIPVSPNCRSGTADECSKAAFVPGSEYPVRGIDIQTLMSNRMYSKIFKSGECTLCENPLLKEKPLQKLPFATTDWKANISCQEKVLHSVHQSPISVAKALAALQVKNDWRKGLDVKNSPSDKIQWALGGSQSMFTKECKELSSRDKYTFLLHHMSCSYYKFRIDGSKLLRDDFQETVNLLPEKYDHSSNYQYFQLIRFYGTHWIKELDLGAHVRYLTYIRTCEAVLGNLSISELSHCVSLDMGIPFGLSGSTNSLSLQECEEKRKSVQFIGKLWEIEGGTDFSKGKEWLESAKSLPGLISSSVEPLHTLLDQADPRRESLRQALSDYLRKNALRRNCTKPCPPGSQPDDREFCSCQCPSNNFTNSMCCAPKRGLGKLMVTIERAEGLWGDFFTRTDGYVSVSFNGRKMCTDTVWNNNNPTWNAVLDFGAIYFTEKDFSKLEVEVWDEDSGWNDDLLGRCIKIPEPGIYEFQICYLNNGKMHFKYHLFCGHKLGGSTCWDYQPYPPPENYVDYYYYN